MARKNKSLFKKSLIIYSGIAAILVVVFLVYIFLTLKSYEDEQTTNVIKNTILSLDDNTLKGYLKDNNQSEDLLDEYKKQINDKDVKVIKKDKDNYEVVLNSRVLFGIATKFISTETKLGMFSYEKREITNIKPNLERGLIFYNVTVPSTYKVYADNKLIEEATTKEKYKNLDYMYQNNSMPYMVTYEINGLTKEESIKVVNEYDEEVKLKQDKYSYTLEKSYINVDSYDEAKKYLSSEVDVWDFAHNWSLFLTNDLSGLAHGYNTIKQYFIEGTSISKQAYNWAHGIDINFTSRHKLKNPPFTNEKLSNFTIYSKDAFSCEIYSEKNMIVNGKDQLDVMHDYIYYIKDNGVWKVVNIKAGD